MTTLMTLGGILVLLALGLRIEALHGASLPREFERQDMEKNFAKKIKIRFPILFKRAIEFQMLKAQGRIG